MNILFYAGGWPTNIGNSFIDYCSPYTIKAAVPDAKIYYASELPRWFFKTHQRDMDKSLDLAELIEIDYLVVSGMVLCDAFIDLEGPVLQRLSDRGVKIIFNGCGGADYTNAEVNNFKRFLKSINVIGFISRDEVSYNNFKDCFSKSHNGLDCAFFLPDVFTPAPLRIKDYVVYNFDSMEEPNVQNNKKIIRTHHLDSNLFPNTFVNDFIGRGTLLTMGFRKQYLKIVKDQQDNIHFRYKDTLISDIPDDYLNVYASTYATYSDRVHACIATLSFGNLARLYSSTPRSNIFDRVGAGKIRNNLVKLDQEKLKTDREKHILFLKDIFKDG